MVSYMFYSFVVVGITLIFHLSTKYQRYTTAGSEQRRNSNRYNFVIKKETVLVILSIIAMGIVAAFRGNAGTDSYAYRFDYENDIFSSQWREYEEGFVFLSKCLRTLNFSYQAFFFVLAVILSLFICMSIMKEKRNIDATTAIFVFLTDLYLFSFNGTRQAIAIGICLYAVLLFLDEKFIKGIIVVLFATLFHRTALICLGIVLIQICIKYKRSKLMMTAVILGVAAFIMNPSWMQTIVKYVFRSDYYTGYITKTTYSTNALLYYCIMYLPVFIVILCTYKGWRDNPRYRTLMVITIVGYVLSSLEIMASGGIGRIGYYLKYSNILSLAYCARMPLYVPFTNRELSARTTKVLIFVYCFILMVFSYFIKQYNQIIPYGWF